MPGGPVLLRQLFQAVESGAVFLVVVVTFIWSFMRHANDEHIQETVGSIDRVIQFGLLMHAIGALYNASALQKTANAQLEYE